MFESIFGAEMPLALRFFIAFLVVLGLIGLTAWVVRRFGADRFGNATTRGRAPRLAVIDAASVDSRRRLIIIRRDNVEHLLMIGGPSDVVVETNIVRAASAARVETVSRGSADTLPRAMPLGDGNTWQQAEQSGSDITQWQQQPAARPSPRSVDTIAGLAAEFSARPVPATDLDLGTPKPRTPATAEQMRASPPSTPPLAPDAPQQATGDQNLAEMAQRLEQALRRPGAQSAPAAVASPRNADQKPKAERPAAPRAESAAAQPDAKPALAKQMYDSLEQEMASLLGRPKAKS